MSGYNGWTNRETWLASLYCDTVEDIEVLRETLEDQEEKLPQFFRELVDLSKINWDELKESLQEEEKSYE